MLKYDRYRRVRRKGKFSRNHLIKHYAERIYIASGVDLAAAGLLWRDVVNSAYGFVNERQSLGFRYLGDAEVGNANGAALHYHDVLRLDIAVNDTFRVCVVECEQYLLGKVGGFRPFKRKLIVHVFSQGDAVYIFHNYKLIRRAYGNIIYFYNVRVVQYLQGFGFVYKALYRARIIRKLIFE